MNKPLKLAVMGLFLAFLINCGGSNVSLATDTDSGSGSGGTSSSCSESASTITTGSLTATPNGTACNIPDISNLQSDRVILDCSTPSPGRDTNNSSTDYVEITCTAGSDTASADYFCESGTVVMDQSGTETTLFDTTTVECTTASGGASDLSEAELIISSINPLPEDEDFEDEDLSGL